ncbi:MAG TPA: prephenate dehydrogenase [Actinomycetales bacterium]|jgi:prephenate dehydrogenase|nr:prephenate dehydrogenase [Actinomycetales bacterium]
MNVLAPAHTGGPVRVVGTGLLGASVGLGLRSLGVDVVLHDASPTALAMARDVGAGRLPDEDADGPVSLVVVAAPPDVTADLVAAELLGNPRAVVTDVASVKASVLREVRDVVRDPAVLARYVGGHPMAGRERSGAVAARADLFAGRPWVLTPGPDVTAEAMAAVRDLATDLGAVPLTMSPEAHDEAVARVSHVPQVLASLVAARLLDSPDDAVALAGQGLRDVTRIAASDPTLWVQILGGNAGPVAEVLAALRDDLDGVVRALRSLAADAGAPGARATVARAIQAGNEGQARIPGKHGAPPTRYEVVTVLVPDRPGELGRLFTEMGEIGVNLEDLRLEHSPGQPVGLAEVSVVPGARALLEDELVKRGWTIAG